MTLEKYEIQAAVIVGNVGYVYQGNDEAEARLTYAEYVKISKSNVGRAGGETVSLIIDGEIKKEHEGDISGEMEEEDDGESEEA